jgi:hypothetical protein
MLNTWLYRVNIGPLGNKLWKWEVAGTGWNHGWWKTLVLAVLNLRILLPKEESFSKIHITVSTHNTKFICIRELSCN